MPTSHLVPLISHPDESLWELQGGSWDKVFRGHGDFPCLSPGSWVQAGTCHLLETLTECDNAARASGFPLWRVRRLATALPGCSQLQVLVSQRCHGTGVRCGG